MGYAQRLLKMNEYDLQWFLEERQDATFKRLFTLLRKGYRIDTPNDVPETVWLSFPRNKNPSLILHSDGMISTGSANISFDRESPSHIYNFGRSDDQTFNSFVHSLKPLTDRDRLAFFWEERVAPWLVLGAIWIGAYLLIKFVAGLF